MQASPVALAVLVVCGGLDLVSCDSCVVALDYVCKSLPHSFPPDLSSVVLLLSGVGVLNATAFDSEALTSVSSLTIANAGITDVSPAAFRHFVQLRNLNLYGNCLSQVSATTWFSPLSGLENLNLFDNCIKALDNRALQGFPALISLNLSRNQIHTISKGSFSTQGRLTVLDLSRNNLTYVSPEAFPINLTRVRLDSNPWDCSCWAEDFGLFLRGLVNDSRLEREMSVTCATPSALKGQPVWNVSACPSLCLNVPCSTAVPAIPAVLVVVFVTLCILSCVAGALFLLCTRETKQIVPDRGDPVERVASGSKATLTVSQRSELPGVRSAGVWGRAKSAGPVLSTSKGPQQSSRAEGSTAPRQAEVHRDGEWGTLKPNGVSISERTNNGHQGTLAEVWVDASSSAQGDLHGDGHFQRQEFDELVKVVTALETENPTDDNSGKCRSAESTENLPYLSIGTDSSKQSSESPDRNCSDSQAQGRVIRRVSTWPPTSVQWKERCSDQTQVPKSYCDPREGVGSLGESNVPLESSPDKPDTKALPLGGKSENPWPKTETASCGGREGDNTGREVVQPLSVEDSIRPSQTQSVLIRDSHPRSSRGQSQTDPASGGRREKSLRRGRGRGRNQRIPILGRVEDVPDNHSGSGSPADVNLLQNNEYAFINLLHEVVQNQGRWTRDRWKQTHLNKQKTKQQGQAN